MGAGCASTAHPCAEPEEEEAVPGIKQSYKYRGGRGGTSPAPGPPGLPPDPPASGIIPPISAAKPGVPGLAHAGIHT